MQYFGGKGRIGKPLAKVIQSYLRPDMEYLEPFVGSAWVISNIKAGSRKAGDKQECLIHMFKALVNGWIPPNLLLEEEYYQLKKGQEIENPLYAFAAFGCSFAGKFWGGYARNKKGHNYCLSAKNSLLRKLPGLYGVEWFYKDYRKWNPVTSLIYCDPPYAGTTGYTNVGTFVWDEFWQKCRDWTEEGNIVLVSEYNAPEDFGCIWQTETKTDIRNKAGEKEPRVERLFQKLLLWP